MDNLARTRPYWARWIENWSRRTGHGGFTTGGHIKTSCLWLMGVLFVRVGQWEG